MAVNPLGGELVQPLGLTGETLQPVPTGIGTEVAPTSTLRPIDPSARVFVPLVDPFAEFQDAPAPSFDQFQDAPDAFAGFKTADDLDVRSVDEIAKDRQGFDPVTYFAQNPDAPKDPAKLKKLLDVYRRYREEGLTVGGVAEAAIKGTPELVGDIAKGVKTLTEGSINTIVQPTANVILGTLSGDLLDKQRRDALFNETRKIVKKGTAEVAAGAESAAVGLVDLSRTGLRKLREPTAEMVSGVFTGKKVSRIEQTDQELLAELSADAAFRQNAEDILVGQGESAKNLGLDKETLAKQGIELDPEAIRLLSLVDPVTMIATGGAFKLVGLGGKVLGTAKTLAGAKQAIEKLAELAKYSSGKTIQGTGNLIAGTGTLLKGTGTGAATIAGISSAVSGGGIPQSLIIGGITKAVGPLMRSEGKRLAHFGRAIAGEVPVSATSQKVLDYAIKPAVGAAETLTRGAFTGIAAASPFAIAAETDEQAGALLGAGAALGAGAGVSAGAFRVVKNSAARRYFGENRPVLEDVPSPGYGIEPELDKKHAENIQKLSAQDASELNNFREILRPQGGEFYSLDRATWRKEMERVYPDLTPEQLDIYENHSAFFDEAKGPDRRVVYLNADNTGLRHDAGHIFDSLLTPEKRTELRKAVTDTFGQKSIEDFKKTYQDRVGNKISDAAALDEYIAEQFNALFYNVPVTELNAPKSLLNKFIDIAAEGAEALGIDLSAGATTPSLGAPVSVGIRKLFQNAAGEVTRRNVEGGPAPTNVTPLPPTPPPAPPGTAPVVPPTNIVPLVPPPANVVPLTPAPAAPTAPAGRSIRVTPEQVAAFKQRATPEVRAAAAARAAETGVDYARGEAKKAEGSPTSAIIERISDSMESGAPVVGIEHLGITSASTPEAPLGRGGRRPEQAAGYAALEAAQLDVRQNAPPEIVAQHSKNFVPVRWTDQGGTPTLSAMSLDKVISNVLRIAADPKAKDLIPYAVENGKLTPDGWREVVADAQAYSENQANGRKGDGGRLEVPEAGLSIPAENPAYTPQTLSPERANFQNLVQGLAPPQTSRAQPGVMPGNVKGQLLAEANRRPVELPANIPAKQAGKQAFVEFPPRVVQEVNPLRNELARRGVNVRDLLEVTERIRAKDIVSATPKPEINYKAPVTDIIRGGFLPAPTEFRQKNLGGRTVEEFSDYILKSSPEEWKAATDNMTGGLTGGAWNLGLGLKDAGDVAVLKSYADKFSDSAKAAMKAGDFDGAMSQVTRGQFFREAYEAATGTGSAGAAFKRGAAGMESAKPPFPIEATTESTTPGGAGTTEAAKFQPKKKQTAGEFFQSQPEPETRAERGARMELLWIKGKKIEPAAPGDENPTQRQSREDAGWVLAALDPNQSIGFGFHDDYPMFLDLPRETQKTILDYAKQQNLDVAYNGEGIAKRDSTLGPDEKAFAFLPAERLAEPELKAVPGGFVTKSGKVIATDASGALPGNPPVKLTAPAGSVGVGFQPPEAPRPDNTALGLPVEGVDSTVRYAGEQEGLTPARFLPNDAPGSDATPASPSYPDADRLARARGGNAWVRQSAEASNKDRVLLVQFTPELMYPNGPDPVSTPYYDKLYSGTRPGYSKATDFWELPQWVAVATENLGSKADFYAVRNMAEAKSFLEKADYGRVAFSVMDVSKAVTEELVPHIKGKVDLGGYTDRTGAVAKNPNAKIWDSMNEFIESMGIEYKKGFDYRHFRGTEIIPRLELSAGCRHRCTFCTIDRKVTNSPMGEINAQVDSFSDLNAKLVYLNDKTFGQSPNVAEMPRLYKEMKAANPEFDGFVIQTTAAQMRLFTDKFLQESGIRYVELGVETYNDAILKTLRKPATEKLIDEAVEKLRRNNINFIPNIVIGFPGETAATYARTLDFLNRNSDIVSHLNTYNLAVYEGTEISKTIKTKTASDADENSPTKSFYADPQLHENFAKSLYDYGTKQLDQNAAFMPAVRENVAKLQSEKKLSSKAWESLLFSLGDLFSNGGYLYQLEEATLIPLFEAFGVKVEPDLQRVINSQKLSAEEREIHGIRSFSQIFGQAKQQLTDIFVNKKPLDSGNIVSFPVSEATKARLVEETPSGVQQSDIFGGPSEEQIPLKGQEKVDQDWSNILSLLGIPEEAPSTVPFPTSPLRDVRRAKAAFQTLVGKEVPPAETVKPKFLPAEELQPDQTPELTVVTASAGGTPPVEPPTGMVIPPPIAAGAFQPRTEAGRKLEERGYEIVASGEMGSRRVTILDKDKTAIAQISSVQRSPQKAEISLVTKKKGAPSGLGDVLYREVGSQLRDDGVRSLGGQVIAPEPLAIRKKIFGGFDKLTINEDPATYKEALDMAERLGNSDELAIIEPVNKITAATRFLPEDQQDMGFIRQGDAAIKVRDIERERNRIISELGSVQDKDRDALVARLAQVSRDAESAWSQFTQSRAGFLPGERDAQGRPLDKEGNIDYPKWQKESLAATRKRTAEPIAKSVPKGEVSVDLGTATGWVLPNKEFVPLDAAFHEQYLANNAADLNKRFKTKFSETPSVDDRLDALNAGFVRLRNQGGAMRVEANAEKWRSLRSSVLETLTDREGKIDNLVISLLNRKGQQVDSSSAPRLQELSEPEKFEAIAEAVNSLRPGGTGAFQPSEGLPGIGVLSNEEQGRAKAARRIATVRENNPEAVTPQYARDESGEVIITPDGSPKPLTLNYNFIDSPLAKEAAKGLKGVKREEAAAVALGDELVKVYREVEKNPDIKAGAKWYSTARTRLKKVFGDDAKFFAELLGATSARTPVEINYRFALDAYNQFKSGAYDKTIAKYREGKAAWEAQDLGKFPGGEDATRGQFLDWWVAKHDLGVTQSNGKKFGMNSRAVLRVLDGSWASEVQGPKTPNFSGNLTGETFEATIDVWAGRTLQRLANQGGKARWRILPENETGISDADFYLGQAAYRDAAKKLGIKPDALQAVLWFAEKEYWEQRGWTRGAGAAKSDFNVLLAETERAPGGELRMKTPQTGLDFGAEIDYVRKKK